MKNKTDRSKLSWKFWLALALSIIWASFWIHGALVEREYAMGLAIGVFPVIIPWLFWVEFNKRKKSETDEYVWISEYIRRH